MHEKTRFYELDLARVIPMIGMPLVHIYEEFLRQGLAAEGVWAQGKVFIYLCMFGPSVFMISMGMNIVFSSRSTPEKLAKRGLQTIIAFYVLNLFRYIIPGAIASACGDADAWHSALSSSFCSDILFFAGTAFLFFAIMEKFEVKPARILLLTLGMLTIDMLIPEIEFASEYLGIALGKFFYVNGWSCFPILSWMIFPAIGYYMGHIVIKLRTEEERLRFWNNILLGSVVCLVAVGVCMKSYGLDPLLIAASPANSYITDLANVVLDVLANGIWYCFFYYIYRAIRKTRLLYLASEFSKKVIVYYFMHWVLVGWLEFMLLAVGLRDKHIFSFNHIFWFSNTVFAIAVSATVFVKRIGSKKLRNKYEGIC